jgi:hypothetical protein
MLRGITALSILSLSVSFWPGWLVDWGRVSPLSPLQRKKVRGKRIWWIGDQYCRMEEKVRASQVREGENN